MKQLSRALMICLIMTLIFSGTAPSAADAALPGDAPDVYKRFTALCLARGDKTADTAMQIITPIEDDVAPYYIPVEGMQLIITGSNSAPMYFLVITDPEHISPQRERELYADFIQAVSLEVSDADALEIANMLFDKAIPLFEDYMIAKVINEPWQYQYIHSNDYELALPTLMVWPAADQEDLPERTRTPISLSFTQSEAQADDVFKRLSALCKYADFPLAPSPAVEPVYSDTSILLMSRVPLDTAEWSSIYSEDSFLGYSFSVYKDTPAFDYVDQLYMFSMLAALDSITSEEAQKVIDKAKADMTDVGNGVFSGYAEHENTVIVISEDDIRSELIIVQAPIWVENIPFAPPNPIQALAEDAYPSFRLFLENNGETLLPESEAIDIFPEESTLHYVSRQILEDVRWQVLYNDDEPISIVLNLTTTDFGEREQRIFEGFIGTVFGLDNEESYDILYQVVMKSIETQSIAYIPVEGERFSGSLSYGKVSEDYMLSAFEAMNEY